MSVSEVWPEVSDIKQMEAKMPQVIASDRMDSGEKGVFDRANRQKRRGILDALDHHRQGMREAES